MDGRRLAPCRSSDEPTKILRRARNRARRTTPKPTFGQTQPHPPYFPEGFLGKIEKIVLPVHPEVPLTGKPDSGLIDAGGHDPGERRAVVPSFGKVEPNGAISITKNTRARQPI
jgi:hypothetical protein